MTQNELIVMRDLLGDIIEANSERNRLIKELADKSDVNERQDKEYSSLCLECNQLREREANALNAAEEIRAELLHTQEERDESRRRLKEAVLMLEDMWRDYSQIKWHSKVDRKRASEMAAKIKAFADAKEFHLVKTDKGEWVAK